MVPRHAQPSPLHNPQASICSPASDRNARCYNRKTSPPHTTHPLPTEHGRVRDTVPIKSWIPQLPRHTKHNPEEGVKHNPPPSPQRSSSIRGQKWARTNRRTLTLPSNPEMQRSYVASLETHRETEKHAGFCCKAVTNLIMYQFIFGLPSFRLASSPLPPPTPHSPGIAPLIKH